MTGLSNQQVHALTPEVAAFIRSLPKTETHLHIEGALPLELLRKVAGEKFAAPPASWAHNYKFRDFVHFETELLEMAFAWYISPERYHEAAKYIFNGLREQHVKYVETSFASGVIEFLGLNPTEIIAAIHEAVPAGMELRLFMGIHHAGVNDKMMPILEDATNWPGLTGLDLHGVESAPVDSRTKELWAAARAAGKTNKAHAGEFCGPDFVKWVVDELAANRVQHGVRSIEDDHVVEHLLANDIALDMCPISNIKLNVFDAYDNHSLKPLMDAGVTCTVSTDDPISFGNTLLDEYAVLYQHMGLGCADLVQVARNGFAVSLMTEDAKRPQLEALDRMEGALPQRY